jgi:hypothetical protein
MQGFDSRLREGGSHFGSIVPAKSAGFIEANCWTTDPGRKRAECGSEE